MCGRYSLFGPVKLSRRAMAELHNLGLDLESALNERPAHYNIAPTQLAPVVALAEGQAQVKDLRWGLIPSWAKDAKIGARAINARVETVAEKPMFRAAFRARRCLVPASGYFEWRVEAAGKQPYFIHAPDGTVLLFAGLWEPWRPPGAEDWIRSFTIITGEPGKVSGDIHDRQPVIVPPESIHAWLTAPPADALQLLKSAAEAPLQYHAVPKAVGSPRNTGRELVEPINP